MGFDGALFQIFSWFSAKMVFQLGAVSKEAGRLPSEEEFVKKQWRNMQNKDDPGFLIHRNWFSIWEEKVELHALHVDDMNSYGVPRKSLRFLSRASHILASSNGLLFCKNKGLGDIDFFICNPATKVWFPVPTPDGLNVRGTGYRVLFNCCNDDSQEYNLMFLMEHLESNRFTSMLSLKTYSPKENTWKEIGRISRGQRRVALYHLPLQDKQGTVYFLSDYLMGLLGHKNSPFYWPYIVCFDTKNLVARYLKLPKSARRGLFCQDCLLDIFKWGSSVCLVQLNRNLFRLWVLLDSESSKWTPIFKMHVDAMIERGVDPEMDHFVTGFTVLNGKSLVFATQEKLYLYDLTGHPRKSRGHFAEEISEHGYGNDAVKFHSYSNTLRPCGDGASPLSAYPSFLV